MKHEKLTQVFNIRALAIFLVVLGHSVILYSSGWNLYQTTQVSPFLDGLKKLIDFVQMPLFFSLSGFLFAISYRKKRGFWYLVKNKTRRLLIPYFCVGVLFLLPLRLAIGYPAYRGMTAGQLIKNFLCSADVGHLWFLPALFLTFLMAELILTAAERLPGIRKYQEFVLGAAALALYLEGYRIGFGYPPLLGAFHYLLWFSAGYLLYVRRQTVTAIYRHGWIKYSLLTLNAVLAVFCLQTDQVRVLLDLGLRALFLLNAYGAMPDRSCVLTERLSRDSFGIYLFHSPLIYITFELIPNASVVLVVFINLILFGAAAWGITCFLRRLKLGFLIGE